MSIEQIGRKNRGLYLSDKDVMRAYKGGKLIYRQIVQLKLKYDIDGSTTKIEYTSSLPLVTRSNRFIKIVFKDKYELYKKQMNNIYSYLYIGSMTMRDSKSKQLTAKEAMGLNETIRTTDDVYLVLE